MQFSEYQKPPIQRSLKLMSQLNVILFEPEIPQNTGNIGRTCVAVGAKLWLVQPLGFRLSEKGLRRAGLDYWQHLDVQVVDNWKQLRQAIPSFNPWIFTKRAPRLYTEVQFQPGDSLVFGSESRGLPESVICHAESRCVSLPMSGQIRSLNLSTVAGIAMYECQRQFSEI